MPHSHWLLHTNAYISSARLIRRMLLAMFCGNVLLPAIIGLSIAAFRHGWIFPDYRLYAYINYPIAEADRATGIVFLSTPILLITSGPCLFLLFKRGLAGFLPLVLLGIMMSLLLTPLLAHLFGDFSAFSRQISTPWSLFPVPVLLAHLLFWLSMRFCNPALFLQSRDHSREASS